MDYLHEFMAFMIALLIVTLCVTIIGQKAIIDNQKVIIAQNDYITEVLLCNPINLVDDFGTDIIKEKK